MSLHKIKPRRWSRRAKQITRGFDSLRLREGLANYRKLKRVEERMDLAQEIADTRGRELALAYRNVDMVTFGYKRKTMRNGRERIYKTPCVVFVVSEKWTRGEQSEDKLNHIPSHLLAYATIDGKRVVCAVPTDVQPAARFQAVMSHSASAVYAHDGSIGEYGSATIALQIVGPVSAGEYLLSCQHVLSPEVPIDTGKMLSGIEVFPVTVPTQNGPQPAPTSGPVARSVAYGGRIVDGALPSFDVQLAKILDRPWLKGALQDLTLSIKRPFVTDRAMLDRIAQDSNFEILVPPNHPHWIGKHRRPVVGALATYTNPSLGITYQARINGVTKEILVHHWMLAELRIIGTSMPEAGDSGSAVVASVEEDGVTLIGMHIAAHPTEPHSYLIPAWQLFDRANYWKLPQNAVVRPVNL